MVHNSEMGNLSGHQLGKLSGNSELIKGILGVYTLFQSPSVRGVNIPNKQTERTCPGNPPIFRHPRWNPSHPKWILHPRKTNMEPKNWWFGRLFSFSIGWFLGSMLIFQGVSSNKKSPTQELGLQEVFLVGKNGFQELQGLGKMRIGRSWSNQTAQTRRGPPSYKVVGQPNNRGFIHGYTPI